MPTGNQKDSPRGDSQSRQRGDNQSEQSGQGQSNERANQGQGNRGERNQGGQADSSGQAAGSEASQAGQQGNVGGQTRGEGRRLSSGSNVLSGAGGGFDHLFDAGTRTRAPLTGEDFRDWSDRLRDVEEMIDDPELRAEAARIRERARGLRAELKRHSKEPNWDLVKIDVSRPLVELRDRVSEELLRRTSQDALVPLDRDPVPPKYSEKTRRYYERLGSGR